MELCAILAMLELACVLQGGMQTTEAIVCDTQAAQSQAGV